MGSGASPVLRASRSRRLAARAAGAGGACRQEDDLGLLLRYGADCIGAVSVRPQECASCRERPVTEAAGQPRDVRCPGFRGSCLVVEGPTGAFRPAGAEGPAPYIAKFNSERIDTLVRNEALSLRWLGCRCSGRGRSTRSGWRRSQSSNEIALIVTRFDRDTPTGRSCVSRTAPKSSASPEGRDYAGKYDAAYEDIAAVIAGHSSRPAIDLARFYRRLIAFALVGNCDAHLKNFSLLETADGLRLSPAYDVLNTAIYDGYDQTLALSIDGRKLHLDAVTGAVFRGFGRAIGLPARAIDVTFAELRRAGAQGRPDHRTAARRAAGRFRSPLRRDREQRMPENPGGIAPLRWRAAGRRSPATPRSRASDAAPACGVCQCQRPDDRRLRSRRDERSRWLRCSTSCA